MAHLAGSDQKDPGPRSACHLRHETVNVAAFVVDEQRVGLLGRLLDAAMVPTMFDYMAAGVDEVLLS